jgi:hypothetical protein
LPPRRRTGGEVRECADLFKLRVNNADTSSVLGL